MFEVGDSVCYIDTKAGKKVVCHGMVLEIKEQIKISYHNTNGQEIVWVDPTEIDKINSSRCSHNAECGWCDDTGECIYEQK
jgi:hypothetical protein